MRRGGGARNVDGMREGSLLTSIDVENRLTEFSFRSFLKTSHEVSISNVTNRIITARYQRLDKVMTVIFNMLQSSVTDM